MPDTFGSWQSWEKAPYFTEAAFKETINGGQAFRWNQIGDFYEGRWSSNVVRLRYVNGSIFYALPANEDVESSLVSLSSYFACNTDFSHLTELLPLRSDPILATAVDHFNGLRILRQPFAETLLCFLCSSTKQITQIKAICEALASDLGVRLSDGSYALPTWESIAQAGEARLRANKLGYRARYIYQTSLFLVERPHWLEETAAAPTSEARRRLMKLPGVGQKIADCVLLFGAGRLEAFPIDTWVERILACSYNQKGRKHTQMQDFARVHFGTSAGYAQQYLFASARAGHIPCLQ